MPEVKNDFKNVYYDTAASPYLYRDSIYSVAQTIVGSNKILFGSDYPLIAFERYKKAINNEITSKSDIENILWKNTNNILNLGY